MSSVYRVKLKKTAIKFLQRQDTIRQLQIKEIIEQLRMNPYEVANVKPLQGFEEKTFRVRFGQFRIIYQVIDHELTILVLKIGPRGDVYK